MVKDILKGFAYALGRIIAFIFIGLLIGFLINNVDLKKIPLNQLIMKTFFVNAYAQTNITPSSKNFYWSAQNQQTSQIDTANFSYNSGWFVVGVATNRFDLLRQGALLNYQAQAGNYSAQITYAWSTLQIDLNGSYPPQYCNIWASDLQNNSCSIISTRKDSAYVDGYTRDVIYTTVQYNWNSSSGYTELYLDYTSTWFQPAYTYFKYTIDQFYYNPDFSSQIIDQNNVIINQNNEINNNITNINDSINDSSIDNHSAQEFLEDMEDLHLSDTPVSDLILAFPRLINKFITGISGQCSTVSLGSWYDHTINIPCINLESILGSTIYGVLDLLCSFTIILSLMRMFINDFSKFTHLAIGGNLID